MDYWVIPHCPSLSLGRGKGEGLFIPELKNPSLKIMDFISSLMKIGLKSDQMGLYLVKQILT